MVSPDYMAAVGYGGSTGLLRIPADRGSMGGERRGARFGRVAVAGSPGPDAAVIDQRV